MDKIGQLILIIDIIYRIFTRKVIYFCIIVVHLCELIILPPEKYPYLYSLIYAMLGFIGFVFIFIQSNLFMIREYKLSDSKNKI